RDLRPFDSDGMPLVTHVTINGATVRAARTLEVNRILKSPQYAPCPQPFHLTKPASKNEERKGPMKTTQRQKKPTLLRRFSLTGPPMRYRVRHAPITASQELLMNQHRTIVGGTCLCSSTPECAGNASTRTSHQLRSGVNRSSTAKIELGGQRVETGEG